MEPTPLALVEDDKRPELPLPVQPALPDMYRHVASGAFSAVAGKLTEKIAEDKIDILPSGELYMAQIEYRRKLNECFGPGAWALVPLSKTEIKDHVIFREYALVVHGRFISQAVGEQEYIPNNPRMTYATAAEAAKSCALSRCCKDLGIAAECWDKRFCADFKERICVQVYRTKSGKYQWRRKDADPFPDETSGPGTAPSIGSIQQTMPTVQSPPTAHPTANGSHQDSDWREMISKFGGNCFQCGEPMAKGSTIEYNRTMKKARHVECPNTSAPLDIEEQGELSL